jgi:hypothetical protein
MKTQLIAPLIGVVVSTLLSIWRMPGVRDGLFARIGKLPRPLQWLAPLCLSMAATAGEGFLGGKTGEELFYYAMGSGAEAGAFAIAAWHVAKRIYEFAKARPGATVIAAAVAIAAMAQGCSLESARQTRINSQLKAGTYAAQTRPEAECKALDSVHVYTAYGAELSLGVGTAAGVLAAADTSDPVRNTAVGVGIGAAVVAAGLGAWSASSGEAWTERCSQ